MTLMPGAVVGRRYRLDTRIAGGGMGEVWRGVDELLGRTVAVKVLQSELVDDPEFLARFRAEARHTAALSHPGIASVFDYGEATEDAGPGRRPRVLAYLVMELVEGEPLSGLLTREGRLDPPQVLDVLAQTAAALQAAHDAGVVHRDVKPGNLILRRDGVVKVTDFGIARATDSGPLTMVGTVLGTAYYLSPEQAAGRPVTPASDLYALGVVGFELLTGRRPFTGSTATDVARAQIEDPPPPLPTAVPRELRELIATLLAKDPARRPTSARLVARRARDLLADLYGEQTALGRSRVDEPTRAVPLPPVETVSAGAATTALPAIGDPPPQRRERAVREYADAAPPPPAPRPPAARRRLGPAQVVLGVGVLLLIGLVALLANAVSGRGPRLPVPGVIGQTQERASEALRQSGFVPRVQAASAAQAADSPVGTVVGQDPQGSSLAREGSTVTLRVVAPPDTVTVTPGDYLGRPFDEAQAALQKLGLQVRRAVVAGESGQEPGTVKAVSPTGDLAVGSLVTVSVYGAAPSPSPSPSSPSPSASRASTSPSARSSTPAATATPRGSASLSAVPTAVTASPAAYDVRRPGRSALEGVQ